MFRNVVLYLLGPALVFSHVYPTLHFQQRQPHPRYSSQQPGWSLLFKLSSVNAFASASSHWDAPGVCACLWSLQLSALHLLGNLYVWGFISVCTSSFLLSRQSARIWMESGPTMIYMPATPKVEDHIKIPVCSWEAAITYFSCFITLLSGTCYKGVWDNSG